MIDRWPFGISIPSPIKSSNREAIPANTHAFSASAVLFNPKSIHPNMVTLQAFVRRWCCSLDFSSGIVTCNCRIPTLCVVDYYSGNV